ncbi:MAG: class I SAM-dependent methyltransferase [Planctomycetaceae bacterium]|nr:class I SAM-dependent methyltransferase [Planctomycetaceae bacterium]
MAESSAVPEQLFKPLTSNELLIEAIRKITSEPRESVIQRLLAEHRAIGFNVRQDAREAGLVPYVWSDALTEFYRTTKSFVYETAVWNRSPLKCDMRAWIGKFLRDRSRTAGTRALTYGDGLGFDSTYLARLGCDVTYFEPSEECSRFAADVFRANGAEVRHIADPALLEPDSYDVIVCLDVLEHVPAPPETVRQFSQWLKTDGYLITHSPFFYVEPYHPTHLKSNMKYSGCDRMFRDNGLQLVDGKFFWDPIALQKCHGIPQQRSLTAVRIGRQLLRLGRWHPNIHSLIARLMSRGEKCWIRDLESLL